METTTIELPAYWASAIINDDDSGLNDWDREHLAKELDALFADGMVIVDMQGETHVGHYAGLGCDMATYVIMER
jgi:hypothetical protein